MDVAVLVEPVAGGFRASAGGPLAAAADGPTRQAALDRLHDVLAGRLRAGAEVVRLRVDPGSAGPVWPDDDLTRDWLAGVAAARAAADVRPDPWDGP